LATGESECLRCIGQAEAKSGIGKYFSFYNSRRPHTALDRQTPDHVYFDSQPLAAAA
jgi:putative transposase